MARRLLALAILSCCACAGPAAAQQQHLPTCTQLFDSVKHAEAEFNERTLRALEFIVEDWQSDDSQRQCTALAHYNDGDRHLTYTARWDDASRKTFTVLTHETMPEEELRRAVSLRRRLHPPGLDGTFLPQVFVASCDDPEYRKLAEVELRYGISFRNTFYREPAYSIFSVHTNGYGSGILTNCIATVGDANERGDIFLGTNWVSGGRQRFEFYILDSGPNGWKLKNRLWLLGTE